MNGIEGIGEAPAMASLPALPPLPPTAQLPEKVELPRFETVAFPLLTTSEVAEIMAARRLGETAVIKATLQELKVPLADQAFILARERNKPTSLSAVDDFARSVEGAPKFLTRSLQKAGKSAAEIAAIFDRMPLVTKRNIAVEVAAIFEPPSPEEARAAAEAFEQKATGGDAAAGFGGASETPTAEEPKGFRPMTG